MIRRISAVWLVLALAIPFAASVSCAQDEELPELEPDDAPAPDASVEAPTGTAIETATGAVVLPEVLIMIDPSLASPWGPNQTVFKTISKLLREADAPLVNARFNSGLHWQGYELAKTSTPNDAAAKLGLRNQAALVVVFSCKTLKMGFEGDLLEPYTYRATVFGNVLEAATGRPVKHKMVFHRKGNGADDEAAEQNAAMLAASAFGEESLRRILYWSRLREESGEPVLIRFWGVEDYGSAIRLRALVGAIARCSDVKQKAVSIGDPNFEDFAEVSLRYRGSAIELRDMVISALSGDPTWGRVRERSATEHLLQIEVDFSR
ncbi:MAG: hypothetical protein JW759_01635 [Candidatus Coatesbacteria bacterium]|nr:hypothetical protein [Candidatus Coatesbacteria bacterium]